jgi:2-oxoglutarate dehydrogenase E2 component (dihydrolipoamide succinyltransferase)
MTIKIVVPAAGESVVEATVGRWLKQEGDRVAPGDALVELETDKVNLEVAAERGGVLVKIEQPEGTDVHVGDVLGIIEEGEGAQEAPQANQAQQTAPEVRQETVTPVQPAPGEAAPAKAAPTEEKVTPMARRLAEEHRVDLSQVPSSDGGRVTRQDVEAYLEKQQPQQPAAPPKPAEPQPAPPASAAKPAADGRPETRERMSRRRQTIAQRLVEAQQTAAMLTTFNEIDMGAVMDLRKRRQESFTTRYGVKLGFMSFFVKAAIGALKAFPALNAEIEGKEIIFKHYYDIGIAVGAEEGLVVPVLRDAGKLSFARIEQMIKEFADKAKNNTLSLEDLRGGTFTITNGGVFGSLLSTPILNTPQVGILGLHKIEERPVAVKGEIVIRPMMYVALSYDHRIVDGREAVQFLVRVKELIEDPEVLLLEG